MGIDWKADGDLMFDEPKLRVKLPPKKTVDELALVEDVEKKEKMLGTEDLMQFLDLDEQVETRDWQPLLGRYTADVQDHFIFGRELGRGHFGVVRQCEEQGTGRQFACKSIAKKHLKKKEEIKELHAEIEVMQRLAGHPNITQLRDVYEDADSVHLVMELCAEGDLFDYIAKRRRLPEVEAAKIFRQILLAVHFCHKQSVIHRDLKPENILFSRVPKDGRGEYEVKLADFGLAVVAEPTDDVTGVAGSPFYMAPELIRRKGYNMPIDAWSLGVILYTALSGFLPFFGKQHEQTFAAICAGNPDYTKRPWPAISPDAKSLVRKLLTLDSRKRGTIEDALQHPWILAHCPRAPASRVSFRPLSAGVTSFTFQQEGDLMGGDDEGRQKVQQALSAPRGRFTPSRPASPVSSPRAFQGHKPSVSHFLPSPPGTPNADGSTFATPFSAAISRPWRVFLHREKEEKEV